MRLELLARVLRKRRQLRRHDRWSRAELEAYQAAALRELRDFAVLRSPFYAEMHRGLERRPLHELPIVTKEALMARYDQVVTVPGVTLAALQDHLGLFPESPHLFRDRFCVATTSGTSGQRGVFFWDADEWAAALASYARAQDWAGVPARLTRPMRMAVVSSRRPWHASAVVAATVDGKLVSTLRLDATDPLESIAGALESFRPDVLVAYASMGRALAELAVGGHLAIRPRAVLTASEVLTPGTRRRIAEAFGVEPFDTYAATETAGISAECTRHAKHLFEDLLIPEVVDQQGRPVPLGTAGARLLVTVLFARSVPLIRYEVTDRVILAPGSCTCGRPFALIERVEGRSGELLSLPAESGGKIDLHPNVVSDLLDALPVRATSMAADGDGLRVLLEADPGRVDLNRVRLDIERALSERGAMPRSVDVRVLERLPRSAAGKAPALVPPSRDSGQL